MNFFEGSDEVPGEVGVAQEGAILQLQTDEGGIEM